MKKRRKGGTLVSEHLENVKGIAVEQYQDVIKDFIRGRNGLYSLYHHGKLVYVGLATNLLSRLKHHLKDRHKGKWDSFNVYLTKNDRHLRELEALVMRIADPKNNLQKGKFSGSYNLEREFKKGIKDYFLEIGRGLFEDINKKDKKNKHKKTKKKKKSIKKVEGKIPVLAQYVKNETIRIRLKTKGKTYWASILRDGRIRYRGKIFTSPSLSAYFITKHPINGWYHWHYRTKKGEWVRLNNLRK